MFPPYSDLLIAGHNGLAIPYKSTEEDYMTEQESAAKPTKGTDRAQLMRIATAMQDPVKRHQAIQWAPDEIVQRSLITTWLWGRYGFQSVELPQTFAAALMATDAKGAFEGHQLPWPAFEIQVPPGLLRSSHGYVWSVVVSEIPKKELTLTGGIAAAKYFVSYHDETATGGQTFPSIEEMFGNNPITAKGDFVTEELAALYDSAVEDRVWAMVSRLIAGVVLTINTARVDKPEAYPQLPPRVKHDKAKINTHRVGRVMQIDCRQSIRDFVQGVGGRSAPKSVSTLVRGHWHNQAYGPQWKEHRMRWREPYFRGDGPLTTRTIKVKPPEEGSHESTRTKSP
jgi:hypothetical protein